MSKEYLNAEETTRYVKLSAVSIESLRAILDRSGLVPPTEEAVREYAEAGAALELLVVERDVHPTTGQTRAWLESELTGVQEKINSAKTKPTKTKWQKRRTEITALLDQVPAVALENQAERDTWQEKSLLDVLRQMAAAGAKARTEMAEELTKNVMSAVNALEWQDSVIEATVQEHLARQALVLIEEHGWNVVEATENVLDMVEKRLLNDYLTGSSTGFGHRTVANVSRKAHSRFRDRVRWYLN